MKTSYPNVRDCHYRISAKAILRNPEWKFALCMKEMMVHWEMQSRFDIPGGGIDHGEDALTTLRREIMEETGLTVTYINPQPKYFFVGESTCETVPLGLLFYEVEVEHFDYTPTDECREMKFFSLEEALEADVYPAIRTSFEEAKRVFGEF